MDSILTIYKSILQSQTGIDTLGIEPHVAWLQDDDAIGHRSPREDILDDDKAVGTVIRATQEGSKQAVPVPALDRYTHLRTELRTRLP